jgi:hypothetical protein
LRASFSLSDFGPTLRAPNSATGIFGVIADRADPHIPWLNSNRFSPGGLSLCFFLWRGFQIYRRATEQPLSDFYFRINLAKTIPDSTHVRSHEATI